MFVPYADPRAPYHRKAAFDLGSNGAGVCANNLALGCDCLGLIKYFDAHLTDINGNPRVMKNVICCHEVDDGLLWKHLNFRTQKAALVRSRTLVLQSIITVSNYEYILAFIFDTAGAIHYEVRATGIVSTVPIGLWMALDMMARVDANHRLQNKESNLAPMELLWLMVQWRRTTSTFSISELTLPSTAMRIPSLWKRRFLFQSTRATLRA